MLFPMVPFFLLCVKRPLNKVSGKESGKNNKNNNNNKNKEKTLQ